MLKKTSNKKSGIIFRRYRIVKGKVLDAYDYGYKAWPIPVSNKKA